MGIVRQLPPASVWIDHRLTLGPSAIEGCGLFFAEPLPAGTVVVRLGGRLVNSSELESLIADPAGGYIDTITVYDDVHLVLPSGSLAHYGNHSCDPTLWHTGPYELATRRDVGAGEEATIDYATQSGAPGLDMACSCGSPACRGRVTGNDWQRTDLQQRYHGHWVPALQQRIEAR